MLICNTCFASTDGFEDRACNSLRPAVAGGARPTNKALLVIRWLGWATFEVAYRGKIILLDAFIDEDPHRGVGIKVADIKYADAILIGHAHFDHILNAPPIAAQTGAPVFSAPAGRRFLEQQGVPASKIRIVQGGEKIRMSGFTVDTALAVHATHDPAVAAAIAASVRASDPLFVSEQRSLEEQASRIPPGDPLAPEDDIIHRGTIAYVVTFDRGITIAFRDSPAAPTDDEHRLVEQLTNVTHKPITVAILGYQGDGVRLTIEKVGIPLAKAYRPMLLIPAHQDHIGDLYPDIATEPFIEALRSTDPSIKVAAPIYRSPVCVNTLTGAVFNNVNAR